MLMRRGYGSVLVAVALCVCTAGLNAGWPRVRYCGGDGLPMESICPEIVPEMICNGPCEPSSVGPPDGGGGGGPGGGGGCGACCGPNCPFSENDSPDEIGGLFPEEPANGACNGVLCQSNALGEACLTVSYELSFYLEMECYECLPCNPSPGEPINLAPFVVAQLLDCNEEIIACDEVAVELPTCEEACNEFDFSYCEWETHPSGCKVETCDDGDPEDCIFEHPFTIEVSFDLRTGTTLPKYVKYRFFELEFLSSTDCPRSCGEKTYSGGCSVSDGAGGVSSVPDCKFEVAPLNLSCDDFDGDANAAHLAARCLVGGSDDLPDGPQARLNRPMELGGTAPARLHTLTDEQVKNSRTYGEVVNGTIPVTLKTGEHVERAMMSTIMRGDEVGGRTIVAAHGTTMSGPPAVAGTLAPGVTGGGVSGLLVGTPFVTDDWQCLDWGNGALAPQATNPQYPFCVEARSGSTVAAPPDAPFSLRSELFWSDYGETCRMRGQKTEFEPKVEPLACNTSSQKEVPVRPRVWRSGPSEDLSMLLPCCDGVEDAGADGGPAKGQLTYPFAIWPRPDGTILDGHGHLWKLDPACLDPSFTGECSLTPPDPTSPEYVYEKSP